ncbi:hypothetical protein B0H19DRAFT_1265027 [Mycena capillaripes]|nr:hypothetical protein B0H19DRAFT_1265027 [Mycena capillaripes]
MSGSSSKGVPLVELDALHDFLHHSSQFGFFLNVKKFWETVIDGKGQRPTTVLLEVVYLWAIHLSDSDELREQVANYLSRACRTAVDSLSGTHKHNTILHSIQASVLLSHYFMRNTRFLEGKYHLSAAVSLILSSGMHRIRSADPHAVGGPLGPAFRRLPPARDAIEESERINAFWTVLTMNNCWTTADGSPSNIAYTELDARIDTPWPLDINSLGPNGEVLLESGIGTVTTFLANLPDSGISEAAFHAKGAILFHQASRLASQYRPNMNHDQANDFYRSFNSIDTVIEGLKSSLPTVHMHSTRTMLLIHSLVHVATIQLHNPFVGEGDVSRFRVLDSARAIVTALAQVPVNEFVFIDPIMGTLLMATCQVFVTELGRARRHRPSNGIISQGERALVDAIDTVLAVMNVFAPRCRLMESQLIAMRQIYHGL